MRSTLLSGAALVAPASVAILGAAIVATPAAAQDYTAGAIAGSVVDQAGKPVGGARVTITSKEQGFTRSTTTTAAGGYRFAGLPIGSYNIVVESTGNARVVQENVRVAASTTTSYTIAVGAAAAAGEEVVVSGTRQNFDFANTTTGVRLDVEDLVKDVPVGRDLTSLTLFAPGSSRGDTAFGNLSSLGGSSVAENAYYINGLNITDFNNYLGSSTVPFEFYKSVEVKTGGYPAEFGRATGGVVNAVTKSGTNEFKAALHINWEPNALRSDSPDTFAQANRLDEARNFSTIFEAGGPLIKDHLFVYGLYELRDNVAKNAGILSGTQFVDTAKSPFWGGKVDGYLTDNQHFEFTYFDSARSTTRQTFGFDNDTSVIDPAPNGQLRFDNGGASYVAKYTGRWTNWFTISAAYGRNNDRSEIVPQFGSAAERRVSDATAGGIVCGGATNALCSNQTTTTIDFPQTTSRKFWRADADLFFNLVGDHHVRVGFDRENNLLRHDSVRTGPGPTPFLEIYRTCGTSGTAALRCQGPVALAPTDQYVELNYFSTGGSFTAKNIAYYVEDEWKPTRKLTLNLGVRLDQFNNFTANGSQFVDFNKLFAPRAGFSYDVLGNGRSKFYANFGVYFLPIAGNTAFRQGASETFFREYFTFTGVNSENGEATLGQQLVNFPNGQACPFGLTPISAGAGSLSCNVTSNGSVQDPTASIARNLRATREREIIIGYQQKLTDLISVNFTYTRRNLRATAEDTAIDDAVINYCNDPANGVDQSQTACSSIFSGFTQYTILNPGVDSTIVLNTPLPGETDLRTINFTAAQLGLPRARRFYDAIDFEFDRAFDGKWALNLKYTYSRSRGNTEGYVQSDFGQDDAGITQDFDKLGFTDGAYGFLPNHRAHRVKIYGSYQVLPRLTVGSNIQIESPRRLSCFGFNPNSGLVVGPGLPLGLSPTGPGTQIDIYGAAAHYCNGALVPRGTALKTSWQTNFDTSVRYNVKIPSGQNLVLRADVFNLFNRSAVTQRDEFGELSTVGDLSDTFGLATAYQAPRSVRLGLDLDF